MGFASGSVSFRRFAVIGKAKKMVEQDMLDRLAEHTLRDREMGVPEELEYGWSGGRHILDTTFSFENNVYNDCLLFALRIDTNKVPGDLKKAYQMIEEDAAAKNNPSGFISKNQKREAKDAVRRKLDEELRSGRFRKSKLIPLLWDLPSQTLLSPCPVSAFDKLSEIFSRSFELELAPLSSGSTALRVLENLGKRREYEDLRPSRFVSGPEGEGQFPEYPWVAKGAEPKDFLGNEFLTWLWYESEKKHGEIATEAGNVTVMFDKALDMDCAYGQTGKDTFRGDGVSQMPEAHDALRVGKLPRKAGVVFHAFSNQYSFTFGAEGLHLGGAKLPEVDDAENARVLVEERITLIRDLCKAVESTYRAFLGVRTDGSWESQTGNIRKWIHATAPGKRPEAAPSLKLNADLLQKKAEELVSE